ncbi:transposase, partial [mine drainage metagenome]
MHIDAVPNRTSRPTYLLRESYRIGKKVRKRTLANLSGLADEQIEAIRAVLAGVAMRPVEELFEVVRSRSHGAVQAVRVAMQRLGFEGLI